MKTPPELVDYLNILFLMYCDLGHTNPKMDSMIIRLQLILQTNQAWGNN